MKAVFFMLILMVALMTITPGIFAEEDQKNENDWQINANLNLTLTQNAYSNNWEGGAVGSISWTALSATTVEKQLSEKLNWHNSLKLAFGQTHTQRTESEREQVDSEEKRKRWKGPAKSTDEIDFETIFRFTFGKFIDPYISGRLETKFTNETNDMFDPKHFSEAVGIARQFFKNENKELLMRLGFAFRQKSQKDLDTTNDGGVEFVVNCRNLMWEGRLERTASLRIYQALFYSESDKEGVDDDWKAVDIDLENTFNLNIIKYISVNLYTQLLYDKEIHKGGRFKETLGLGFTYKLF